jgi:integrase
MCGRDPSAVQRSLSRIDICKASWAPGHGVRGERRHPQPAKNVKRPKVNGDHSPTEGLDRDEARELLHWAEWDSARAHVIVRLLLEMGVRAAEVATARAEDLTDGRGGL